MNPIFHDYIDVFIVVYLDDILVFSSSQADHLRHKLIVVQRLRDHQLSAGRNKYNLVMSETNFFGLLVGRKGVKDGDSDKRLTNIGLNPFQAPKCAFSFVYYNSSSLFIEALPEMAAPLTNLTPNEKCANAWNDGSSRAFEELRPQLVESPTMSVPDWT